MVEVLVASLQANCSSCINSAMATVVVPVALSSPEHVASTVAASIARLQRKDSDEYSSRCEALTAALLQLCDHLHQLREDNGQQGDETRRTRLLVRARISASITYSVVDMLNQDSEVGCCSCSAAAAWDEVDPVADGLNKQLKETRSLVETIASYIKATAGSEHSQEGNRFQAPVSALSGVCCLTLTTPPSLDSKIRSGEEIRFPVVDSSSQRLVYTVKTWINNPASWFNRARRLGASIEIEEDGHGKRKLDIRLPEQKDPNSAPLERTAFLSFSGSLQAEVKSVLPDNARINCWGSPRDGAGTLLLRDHLDGDGNYEVQDYSVELRLSAKAFELGLEGDPVRTLRVKGTKKEYKTSYVCLVERTGEVLAIYQHRRQAHFGVVRFIGVGMYPELRDLIMGALVAMGLDSQL